MIFVLTVWPIPSEIRFRDNCSRKGEIATVDTVVGSDPLRILGLHGPEDLQHQRRALEWHGRCVGSHWTTRPSCD